MPSTPVIKHQGGVYQLQWTDEHLAIRIDRVHAEKTGVFGEILTPTTPPTINPPIHGPAHLNLISTTTRRQLVNHLGEIMTHDWVGILEQACYLVVEAHRTGVPAIHLADHTPPDALSMRIAPILQEHQTTLFFGEGDSLKSFMAAYLSVLTTTGKPAVGLSPEPGNILYLDYETDVDTFWNRISMITSGLKIAIPEGIYYRPMIEAFTDEFPRVNALVMEHEIALVVIDSAAPATIAPESATAVTSFFRSLRALGTTNLVVAHMTKSAKGDYPFGSTFWRNLPRSNFRITADRADEDVAISLTNTKSNNGKRLQPLGYKFTFGENAIAKEAVTVEMVRPRDYPELAENVSWRVRIAGVLKRGALTQKEITDELKNISGKEVTAQTISTTVQREQKSHNPLFAVLPDKRVGLVDMSTNV